jgi:glyoxylase-like metal-dependent hydrolase (beta-lactamase superfamily II)
MFTGDALFIRGTGRTDFQQGDSGRLYNSITRRLFTLPDATFVYPGHDYRGIGWSTIGEEKRYNPRLAGKSREQFIEIMAGLKLSMPKKIHEAVPANLNCGMDLEEPAGGKGRG